MEVVWSGFDRSEGAGRFRCSNAFAMLEYVFDMLPETCRDLYEGPCIPMFQYDTNTNAICTITSISSQSSSPLIPHSRLYPTPQNATPTITTS